jgi:antitoxin component of MazEF toxin-antitoxin module
MQNVSKWGNSLAVRIPAKLAEQSGLREGTSVRIEARAGRLIIERARPTYALKDLLAGYSSKDKAEEFWKGPAVGNEAW